jgi:polyphenol oxidase
MFELAEDGVYRSKLLSGVPWIEHGFGTRNSDGWPGDYIRVKQIHSDIVIPVSSTGCNEEGDALVTSAHGSFIGIRTADCVPLLLVDHTNRAVAAVHAGWRGSAANIAGAAVRKLSEVYQTKPADLVVAIGPSIGQCCFEVGSEVAAQFEQFLPGAGSHRRIDLVAVNRRQLLGADVKEAAIDISGLCTACDHATFHSWRRDREAAGRMVTAIRIKEN